MHQAVRKYLRFVVNKKVYQFTCLPFGLATSPREFTKLLRPVVSLLRQQGVKLHVYLDDWLIRADTPEQAQLHTQTTIRVLQFLGWIITYEKSDLTPSQDFQFIGMQFNTRRFTVAPLPKMRLKVQSVHQHWMTDPNITARDLHRLLGMLVFMASLVQRGRLRLRQVQWWAATAWCQRTGNWSDRIQVPQWVLSEMAWWSSPAVLQGLSLVTKETEVTLFTDASSSGWGAQLGSRSTQGQWSASQRLWHINVLEMQAVIYAVRDFLPHLRSWMVRLMCDNAVTVAYIKNEGARDRTLWCSWPYDCWSGATARRLRWFPSICQDPGVHNIQADSLSRVGQTLTMEWTMAMESLRTVFAKWGEPRIDLFATFANRRLVKFVSPYPDPRAEWTDAMSMPWDNGRGLLYAFPPFKMVPQALQKIAVTRCEGDFDRSTATGSVVVPRVDESLPRRSDPAVRRRSRPADTRRLDGRWGDRDSSLPTVKSTCVETLRAILRAKGHSREAANMMSRCLRESSQQVYESHWSRFVAFCRTKRWHMFRVRSHHFSTYMMHLFRDGLLPSSIISHRTSVASVLRHWVLRSGSRPAHQASGQSFPAGISSATQNHA